MYRLNANENKQLAKDIRATKSRELGFEKINDFAKSKGVYDQKKESCFVLDFYNDDVFNAIAWVS